MVVERFMEQELLTLPVLLVEEIKVLGENH
jgi:hypothetical protein